MTKKDVVTKYERFANFMNQKQVEDQTGFDRISLWRFRKAGSLAYIKKGRGIFYPKQAVIEFEVSRIYNLQS